MDLEDEKKEGEVRQEWLAEVERVAEVVAGGIAKEIEQDLFVAAVGQEGMWCGIVLPENAEVAGLSTFDRLGRFL